MFDKKIIVDDYIPHEYDLMDFMLDIEVNKYDQLEPSEEFDYETIMKNEQTIAMKGLVLQTPITIQFNYPINGKNIFEQVVFEPAVLNKGEFSEEIIIKAKNSYIMEKNTFTVTTLKDEKKTVVQEQIPYYRGLNKYHHPFMKRMIDYICERFTFVKYENNDTVFCTVNGIHLDKSAFLKKIRNYIYLNKKRILKEASEYDKAILIRDKIIKNNFEIEFESASFGSIQTFERPQSDDLQYVLVMLNAEIENNENINLGFRLNGDGYHVLAQVDYDNIYDIAKSYQKSKPVKIQGSEQYKNLKSFLGTLNYVNLPNPEQPIPANIFSQRPDGSDTQNIKWLMYDYIKNHQ